MRYSTFNKGLVFGIIVLFIGICIIPNVNSINLIRDMSSNHQSDYKSLWLHSDEKVPDIINSPNIWTPRPSTYMSDPNNSNDPIKSYNSKDVKKSSFPTNNGKTLYVGGSGPGNYSLIQFAINDANDGDTVFVFSGTYKVRRKRIKIDKSINLIGENKETTIIDGDNFKPMFIEVNPVIRVFANGVTISGFTVQNCGGVFPNDDVGILLGSSHSNISGNIISNNNYGIIVGDPYTTKNYNTISDNLFLKNGNYGLVVADSNYNIVSDNVFQNDNLVVTRSNNNIVSDNIFIDDGIWVSTAYHNTFSNNLINDKPLAYLEDESNKIVDIDAGQVILINCYNITVENKDLSNSAYGITLEGTYSSHISGNTIESAKLAGILLHYSNNNNISMNIILDSKNGIVSTYSSRNVIYSNALTSNRGFGVYLAYSEENNILQNTFTDNNPGLILTGAANKNNVNDNVFINDGSVWVYGAWKNIFLNNTLNEKPILYLEEQSDIIVDYDVGQIIIVNCENIEVENQDMSETYAGIMIVESDFCKISNCNFNSHKRYGIFITHSINNNISENIVTDSDTGIALEESNNNIIYLNNIKLNSERGVYLYSESNGNSIISNNIEENGASGTPSQSGSIYFSYGSSDNKIHYNNFLKNTKGWHFSICSSNNWKGNYWDKPRIFPKLIFGHGENWLLSFTIDWRPAKEPFEI